MSFVRAVVIRIALTIIVSVLVPSMQGQEQCAEPVDPELAVVSWDEKNGEALLRASWHYGEGRTNANAMSLETTNPNGVTTSEVILSSQSPAWAVEETYISINLSCHIQGVWKFRVSLNRCYDIRNDPPRFSGLVTLTAKVSAEVHAYNIEGANCTGCFSADVDVAAYQGGFEDLSKFRLPTKNTPFGGGGAIWGSQIGNWPELTAVDWIFSEDLILVEVDACGEAEVPGDLGFDVLYGLGEDCEQEDKSCENTVPKKGDPVTLNTGAVLVTDLDSVAPTAIRRSFNSLRTDIGHFGKGWLSNFDGWLRTLEHRPGHRFVTLSSPTHRLLVFYSQNGEPWKRMSAGTAGSEPKFEELATGGWRLTEYDGSGSWVYDANGLLVGYQGQLPGDSYEISYDVEGMPSAVTDGYGRTTIIESDAVAKRSRPSTPRKIRRCAGPTNTIRLPDSDP